MINPMVDCRYDGRLPIVEAGVHGAVCEAIATAHVGVYGQEEIPHRAFTEADFVLVFADD